MDLKMEIYTPMLELVGILEIHRSVIWEEKAFGAGSFSVDSLITTKSKTLLVPENIVWVADNYAGVIEYVQEQSGKDGPYITVKGPDLTGILEQRILWGQYNLTGTAPAIMHTLANDCCISPTRGDVEARKIPGLVSLAPATGGDSIRIQKTGGTLLEALEELGAAFGVAFGVRFNPAVPQMEFWTRWGQNRSINQDANDPVFYSTELDDVLSSEYSYNAQDWRNVALVAGEGEGGNRVMVTVEADIQPSPTPPEPTKYTITLSVDPEGGGVASGGGQFSEGQSVTVTATPSDGYNFSGWQENGQIVSTDTTYTFTATGNRTLVAVFAVVPVSRLPEGYTEVEYISTDGYTRIPTGIQVTIDTTRVVMDIIPTEHREVKSYFFDATNRYSSSYTYWFGLRNNETDGNMTWASGYYGSSSGGYSTFNYSFDYGKRITIDMDCQAKKLKIGNTDITISPATTTSVKDAGDLNFGGRYPEESVAFTQRMDIYSAQVYLAGILKGDFVPCVKDDGAIGLYNLVDNVFYNASHGTLTPGPAV